MKSTPHLLMLKRTSLNLFVILLGMFFILGSAGTPVITILGDNPVTIEQGSVYVDAGATAKDDDGPRDITTSGLPIDTSKIGTYKVVYSVFSGEGKQITAERVVNVVAVVVVDIVPPVITILGDNPVSVQQGETYTDAGATAVDNVDGNVAVSMTSTVDTTTAGEYKVTYTASDSAGNNATAIRVVNVGQLDTELGVRLDISFFGEGTINVIDKNQSVRCDTPRFCTGVFDKGTTVVVEALPTSGWSFDGWENCDSTDTTKCTITINSDTLISTAFLSDLPLKTHDNVIVLSDSQVREITDYSHDSGVLVFLAGVNTDDFKVGNILVSKGIYIDKDNTDNIEIYFARRITRVVALSGAPVVLTTIEASLEDVIESGVLSYDNEILQSQLPSKLPDGVSLRQNAGVGSNVIPLQIDVVLYDKDGNFDTVNDQIKAKGSIDYSITPDFDFNFSLFKGLTEFRAIMRTSSKSDIKLLVGVEVKAASKPYTITRIQLAPVPVGPVVFIPEIAIKLNSEAKVSAEIGPKLEVSTSASAGAHYLKGHGWKNVGSFNISPSVSMAFDVKASVQAGPTIELGALVYGVAGPDISLNGFVGAEVFPVIPVKNNCFFDYIVFAGVDARFGGKISILGKELGKYEAKLFESKSTFASGGCSVADKENPSSPTISVTNVTTDTVTLNWTASSDNIGVRGYRLHRNHRIITSAVASTAYLDRGLKPDSEYCYYLVAIDTSGNESTISNTECATTKTLDVSPPSAPGNVSAEAESTTSIELTWGQATDDTGVTGYIVLDNTNMNVAPYIVLETSSLNAIVTGLIPETEYCYFVSALDQAGNVSAASTRVCATTKEPEESKWLIKMGCQNREYLLEQHLDLDEDITSLVSVTGTGQDYNGTNLSYSMSGTYDGATSSLDAGIIWTFEGSNDRRRDIFVANLDTDDTGDINMTQVEVTGCDAKIRFIRNTDDPIINDDVKSIDHSQNFLMDIK